ncbi:unnamed protein product [Dicrocoelium dendriticum]|nr:unnamed protein product [Dicrocoelium dendriticum]
MTAPRQRFRPSQVNLVKYSSSREFGSSFHQGHQFASDLVTSQRALKPVLAETSPNSRSTYLLRLNTTNKFLAAAHGDRSVTIYCVQTGRVLAKCVGHERSPWTLVFHPTQPFVLASGCLGGDVRLWDLEVLANIERAEDIDQPHSICCTRIWKHSGAVSSIAFHPSHTILVVACTQEVVFYDWVSGSKLSVWRFVSNYSRVRWVKFSPDGNLLYTATANPSAANPPSSGRLPVANSDNIHSRSASLSSPHGESDETDPAHLDRLRLPRTVTDPFVIPLDSLLEFLIRQPDSWFHEIGVCEICSIRLCRWAGTLGPRHRTSTPDLRQGTYVAAQIAQSVANEFRLAGFPPSNMLQELISPSSNTLQQIQSDASPSAVAIIEDMPVREFLLSRGNYCTRPPTILSDGGLCCGGHACDLVLMHRELMRHSLCRSCLSSFWKWASPRVTWWQWSNGCSATHSICRSPYSSSTTIQPMEDEPCFEISNQIGTTTDVPDTARTENPLPVEPPVGVCVRCQAGVGPLQNPPFSTEAVDSPRSSRNADASTHEGALPLAALELLRSRLSNAHEVTAVTYMAPDLISDGPVTEFIRQSLRSATTMPSTAGLPQCVVTLLRRATSMHSGNANSPQPKRRRMESSAPFGESDSFPHDMPSCSWSRGSASNAASPMNPLRNSLTTEIDESRLHVNDTSPDSRTVPSLPDEAAVFGRLLSRCSICPWNLPRPARVISQSSVTTSSPPKLQLFPFVDAGTRLLRPVSRSASRGSNSMDCVTTDAPFDPESVTPLPGREADQSYDTDGDPRLSVTACCRCGHIVPRTFPVDPESRLSAAVCENFVLPGVQYNPVSNHPNERRRMRVPSGPSLTSASHWDTRMTQHPMDPPSPPRSPGRRGGIMYLVNRTNADSMLNAIHRSITEVISGLFVDMGEHGSANSLEDTTYRICRWELNFCNSVSTKHSAYSFKDTETYTNFCESSSILPMPANIAVSYNANSLVLPHARLFNDSSICLSPDGRMLAAFVTPSDGDQRCEFPHSSAINDPAFLDTFLAVYRLQPKARRGQCLFYRRFASQTPVCLDFSPLCDFLVVGMATTRLPSETLPPASLRRLPTVETLPPPSGRVESHYPSAGDLLPKRHTCVGELTTRLYTKIYDLVYFPISSHMSMCMVDGF